MANREQSEPECVRSLYMDCDGDGPVPRRGDRIVTSKTIYFVLYARRVRRRDPNASVRVQMNVMRVQDMSEGLDDRLLRSAARDHVQSMSFSFYWYRRGKKQKTFEQYMRHEG